MRQRPGPTAASGYDLCRQTGLLAAADIDDIDIDVTRLRTAFDADADALPAPTSRAGRSNPKADEPACHRLDDHIADRTGAEIDSADPGTLGRSSGRGTNDDHPFDAQPRRNGFTGGDNANAGRRHATVLDQFRHDAIDDIGRDRKSDAGAGARRRDDGRVDANQPSRQSSSGPPDYPD